MTAKKPVKPSPQKSAETAIQQNVQTMLSYLDRLIRLDGPPITLVSPGASDDEFRRANDACPIYIEKLEDFRDNRAQKYIDDLIALDKAIVSSLVYGDEKSTKRKKVVR